jgi:hypothetical protein
VGEFLKITYIALSSTSNIGDISDHGAKKLKIVDMILRKNKEYDKM